MLTHAELSNSLLVAVVIVYVRSYALSHVPQAINWDKRVEEAATYLADARTSHVAATDAFGSQIR